MTANANPSATPDASASDADEFEVPVEAVDSIDVGPEGVDAPQYVLYGGKGGVGKTTMAAATALASASDGTPTLVVSTDPAHSLSDVLETRVPSEPGRVRDDVPLYAVEIDPEAAESNPFEQGFGGMDDLVGGAEANPMGGGAMPGADETAALQLLLEYLDDERFERVVVDTAPTGHTLRLLSLPEALDSMVGRILAFREQMSGMLGEMPGPFGDPDAGEGLDQLRDLSERIQRLRQALEDPSRTDFRVVMLPERLSVLESERLVSDLDEFGVPAQTVVVNRVTEDLSNVIGEEADVDWFVRPDTENCAFCKRRWQSQQKALHRAQELFRSREVKRVPMFADEVSGEAMLRVVGACLE
ncbi:ArsA family ATPase [Halomarina ordinaria]|uniref:ArsA family ATPase n=1 Tax=Halomarina ordinaria TaxID=3033939 RepID=A0ABD5UE15_9EURY|nr:TRC40/GET3/ArsA family transport-energizing ATPase [Halomarina sp. PSRA2]